jgi:uncharacterized protein
VNDAVSYPSVASWGAITALIKTVLPRPEFHAYLRRLVDAGFGRNIMYGSDQAVWPTIIGHSLEAIETAEFLSPAQKRNILCANAARFLRLQPSLCNG